MTTVEESSDEEGGETKKPGISSSEGGGKVLLRESERKEAHLIHGPQLRSKIKVNKRIRKTWRELDSRIRNLVSR